MKIKDDKKDMEKTETLFECRRALDGKKPPVLQWGPAYVWFVWMESQVQTSPSKTLPVSLWTGLPWSGAGDDHGALRFRRGWSQTILRTSRAHPQEPRPTCLCGVWSTCAAGGICPGCSWHGQPHSYCRSALVVSLPPHLSSFLSFWGKACIEGVNRHGIEYSAPF